MSLYFFPLVLFYFKIFTHFIYKPLPFSCFPPTHLPFTPQKGQGLPWESTKHLLDFCSLHASALLPRLIHHTCNMPQHSTAFGGWIILHPRNTPHSGHKSWTVGLFILWGWRGSQCHQQSVGKHRSKPQWNAAYTASHPSEWLAGKRQIMTSSGEDVKFLANYKQPCKTQPLWKMVWQIFKILNTQLPYESPAVPCRRVFKRMKS